MKRSTFIILVIFSLGLPLTSFAQPTEWLANDFPGSTCLGMNEVGNKIYSTIGIFPQAQIDSSIDYKLLIHEIQLDQNGGLEFMPVERFVLDPINEYYGTIGTKYIDDTDEWIIIQSFSSIPGKQSYRFMLLDKNFNLESVQYLDTVGYYNRAFYIDSYAGHTYVLGTLLGPPSDQVIFLDYPHANLGVLPSIKIGQTYPNESTLITSMKIDHRTGHMLVFYYNGIQELDTLLNQIKKYSVFDIHTAYHGDVLAWGNYYYSHGAYRKDPEHSGLKRMIVQQYDTLFNILKADTLGSQDHDNYPFLYNSIDYRKEEILIGGHLDGPFTHFYTFKSVKKFYLAKYDPYLNRIWYKEYGGDRAYWMNGIKLLDDGSCFAYGLITDTIDLHQNAYILHVDKNGDILSSTILDIQQNSSILVINPGNESLQILNPELIPAYIHLFDIQGCHIINERVTKATENIDVSFLPPGVYPYSIVQEGRVISSGKWVKL